MYEYVDRSAYVLGLASHGNPVVGVLVVFLYWLAFSIVEAGIEMLIWGERFEHWLDPIFALAFMSYGGLVVWKCAAINLNKVL